MKNTTLLKILSGTGLAILLLWTVFNTRAQTEAPPPPNDADVITNAATEATNGELPSDIAPDSALAQVVQMAQSGVNESIILNYIQNSSAPFNLTANQIIYLKDLGLPDDAVKAMMQRDQQLGASQPPPTQPPAATTTTEVAQPAVITQNYFYDTLSPYGGWVNVEGYGLCWRPTAVIYDSTWQPYCQHGHWVYSDCGWYWMSDYSWGAYAFHYGRWFHHPRIGWCWWPDTTWGPSWVSWRYSNDYCGWAPLPPRCVFRPGVGLFFNGVAVHADFNFGISFNFFTFVPTRNFCDPHPEHFRVHDRDAVNVFNHTTIINNFNVDNRRNIFINNGIPHDRIAAVSRTPIHQMTIRDAGTSGVRGEHFDRNRNEIVVNRPPIPDNAVSTLNRGIRPPVVRHAPRPTPLNQSAPNQRGQGNRNVGAPVQVPQTQPAGNSRNVGTPASTEGGNHSQSDRQLSPRQQQFQDQNHRSNPNTLNQYENPAAPTPGGQFSAPTPPNTFQEQPRQNGARSVAPERQNNFQHNPVPENPTIVQPRHEAVVPPPDAERPNGPSPRERVESPAGGQRNSPRQENVQPQAPSRDQSQQNQSQKSNDGKDKDQGH